MSSDNMSQLLWSLLDPFTILTFGIGFLVIWLLGREPAGLPPGPKRWPVIGSIMDLMKYPSDKSHKTMTELAQKYGGIFTVKAGSIYMVVIASAEIAQECFIKQAQNFTARPVWMPSMEKGLKQSGCPGLIWTTGPQVKALRRFTVAALRDFGMGKSSMEERIQQECEHLLQEVSKKEGRPFDPNTALTMAVTNVIAAVCFGQRFEYDDEEYATMLELFQKLSKSLNVVNPLFFFTWSKYLPIKAQSDEALGYLMEIEKYIEGEIEGHKTGYEEGTIRDFVDLFIQNEGKKFQDIEALTSTKMKRVINDLFFAGSDTTSTAMRWALLYLVANPEMQKRCHKETDKVLGSEGMASLSDRDRLPYINAVIHETLRIGCIAPLAVPHDCLANTQVAGHHIPAQTVIILSVHSIHMNPDHWPEPETFKPDRWLDSQGCFVKKSNFLPFGLGGRVCLGEHMARSEIFLFLTSLLQKFQFSKELDANLSFEGSMGITLQPDDYNIIATERKPQR